MIIPWFIRGVSERKRSSRCTHDYQVLEHRCMLAANLQITEILASNFTSLEDGFGENSDWIELHNSGDAPVDLAGYHLTDKATAPAKWSFNQSRILQPDDYLVVFASSRNTIDPAGNFHTNFSLAITGEYVGLYSPAETLVSQIGTATTNFPAQVTDISYGIVDGTLVQGSSVGQYQVPTGGWLGTSWTANSFNASANGFASGLAAIGYESNPGSSTSYSSQIGTALPTGTTTAYLRVEFNLAVASAINDLKLDLKYDDGFAVYLNGSYLFKENAGTLAWNSVATAQHNDADALIFQPYGLDGSPGSRGNFLGLLRNGKNTLAIHALNTAGSSDFLLVPRLTSSSISGGQTFLAAPTPGNPNFGPVELGPQIGDAAPVNSSVNVNQPLVVSASVTDFTYPVDVASVRLRYRVMFGSEVTLTMNDNGTNGDSVAGDGVFSTTIAAGNFVAGQMVRWYFTASDNQGNETRAPRFLSQINSAEYFGVVVNSASVTTDMPAIQWFIQDTAGAETDAGARASLFYKGEFYDNVRVDAHGQSTRDAVFVKKSFDFDANAGDKFKLFDTGKRHSDFNLLTNYADQTKLRNELTYGVIAASGHPSLSGKSVAVYRNGSFYGLFDLVEEPDEEYLERVGLDPNGALYKVNNALTSAYTEVEKKSREWEDHTDLQSVINAASLSGSALSTWMFDNVDMASILNYTAVQNLVSSIDFGFKNMLWYHDVEGTGLWSLLPWDQDLSFGHRWNGSLGTNAYFDNALITNEIPTRGWNSIFQRLFADSTMQGMYFRRLRTLSDQIFGLPGSNVANSYLGGRIDQLKNVIADEAVADQALWGLHPNYAAAAPFNVQQAIEQIRDVYINTRRTYVTNYSNVPGSQPTNPAIQFDDVDYDANPVSGLQSQEYLRMNNPFSYAVDISGWKLSGGIDHVFRSGTVIPAGGTLYVVADATAFKARTVGPRGGQQRLIQGNFAGQLGSNETVQLIAANHVLIDTLLTANIGATNIQLYLRISEVNYNPTQSSGNAEYLEFLNTSAGANAVTLNLAGVSITDGPSVSYVFPAGTTLAAGQRLVVVKDIAAFQSAFPTVSASQIKGPFSGSLSNSGERIRVADLGGEPIVDFSYGDSDPWSPVADGGGGSLQLINEFATPVDLLDKYYSWRGSHRVGGTPAAAPLGTNPKVVINEILAHTDLPQTDFIELRNNGWAAVDVGGWYLSDSRTQLQKFSIPAGTVIPAGGHVVFDESKFNSNPASPGPNDFALSSLGDDVWLTTPIGQFIDVVEFGSTFNGQSWGRNAQGGGRLTPKVALTPAAVNANSIVGSLLISEVNYHASAPTAIDLAIEPALIETELDFVEISNLASVPVSLNGWRLRGEVDFEFPTMILGANQALVVLSFDPTLPANANRLAAFRNHYGLSLAVSFVGNYRGNLSNSYGRVMLQQSDPPNDPSSTAFVTVDDLLYDDQLPWASADGNGQSLNRLGDHQVGIESRSWIAQNPTPGSMAIISRPALMSTQINDGSAQRSSVKQLVITLSGAVDISGGAFRVTQRSDLSGPTGTEVGVSVGTPVTVGNNTQVTLTFNSLTRNGLGELVDGNYELKVDHTKIKRAGTDIEMTEAVSFGDQASHTFFAFFGNVSGSRTISALDLLALRLTYGRSVGQSGYDPRFSYSGGTTIGSPDLLQFRLRYRQTMNFS